MSLRLVALLLMSVLLGHAGGAIAEPVRARPAYMPIYGETAPIESYVKFCHRLPTECRRDFQNDKRMDLTAARLSELDEVNRFVNNYVVPTPQIELYGVRDHWAYPDDKRRGDCNSYVLLKRKMLISYGWPAGDLLITVVLLENGEGHAVLTARTSVGDLILDNLEEAIKPWHDTSYRYVMRQSALDPNVWIALAPEYTQVSRTSGTSR